MSRTSQQPPNDALATFHEESRALRSTRQRGASTGKVGWGSLVLTLVLLVQAVVLGVAASPGAGPTALAAGFFLFVTILCFRESRRIKALQADAAPLGLPTGIAQRLKKLPAGPPGQVRWRVTRALDAHVHLGRFLVHVRRQGMPAEADALARAAEASVGHIVERCETLLRMLQVGQPSEAVVAARTAVENDVDAHLVELSAAMDAAATFITVDTPEAASRLTEQADALAALADGLTEAFVEQPQLAASAE